MPVRICHSHSTASKGETKKNILKYLLRPLSKLYATHYFSCSEYAGKWLFGKRAYKKKKITIINNAIDIEKYQFNPEIRERIRRELLLGNSFTVGHIGRFVFQKNHEFLIDIFNELHKIHLDSKLLLIGGGPLEEDIKKKVETLHLTEYVQFLGIKENAFEYYQAMDAFVLPSHYEGLPVVAVEAQAAALPILCSDGVTQETKKAQAFEFLPLEKGSELWAKSILKYTNFDRGMADDSLIKDSFSIDCRAKKLEDIYLNLYEEC